MKLSVCTIALRTRLSEEAFRLLARLGYKNLDVLAYGKQAHFSRDMDKDQRRKILNLAKSLGLRIVSFAGSVGDKFNSDVEAERCQEVQKVQDEINLAVEAGAAVIRFSPGAGEDFDKIMSRSVPHLKEVSAYAAKKKVRLGMENHSGGMSGNPDHVAALCREIGSPWFGVIYEPGNLFGMNRDYKQGLETQREYIVHVHLKDGYPHTFDDDMYTRQRLYCTAFGRGKLDIPWIMERLQAIGYDRFVSIEYEGWHPEYHLPPDEEGLAQAKAYLARWLA